MWWFRSRVRRSSPLKTLSRPHQPLPRVPVCFRCNLKTRDKRFRPFNYSFQIRIFRPTRGSPLLARSSKTGVSFLVPQLLRISLPWSSPKTAVVPGPHVVGSGPGPMRNREGNRWRICCSRDRFWDRCEASESSNQWCIILSLSFMLTIGIQSCLLSNPIKQFYS